MEDNTNRPLGLSIGAPLNGGEQRLKCNMKFKFKCYLFKCYMFKCYMFKCYIFKMASCHLFTLMNEEIMEVI